MHCRFGLKLLTERVLKMVAASSTLASLELTSVLQRKIMAEAMSARARSKSPTARNGNVAELGEENR